MRNLFITSSLCFLPSFLFSQISIDVSDIADGGQSFIVSTANPLGEFDLETTGEDVDWDFSDLEALSQDTIDWVDATDTDPAYFLLWFSADVAENFTNGISTDSFTLEDIYNFYDRGSDKLEQTGIAGTISGIPIPASFGEPDVVYDFPMEYGDEFASVSDFSLELIIASFSETRDRSTVVDGWGTITTPLTSYEVLRIKSTIVIEDIIEFDGTEIPLSYTNYEYKWMAKEMGIPVLQINTSDIGGFEAVTAVTYQDTALIFDGIYENYYNEKSLSIFPNPVGDILNISVSTAANALYRFEIFDHAGNHLFSSSNIVVDSGSFTIHQDADAAKLSAGIYILKMYADEELVGVKKFIRLP
ncbi:MAG: T9SS type A sorting domain-containing protein [Chitinophagales bacterium]